MKFAKYTFLISGVYGLLVLVPQYFLETKIGIDQPPAITHPEFFYGFVGLALVFQLMFFVIASDPLKYRTLMLLSVLEKLVFLIPVIILYLRSRVARPMLAAALVDGFWGLLFIVSFLKTRTGQTLS
jgi:hypothetical protein